MAAATFTQVVSFESATEFRDAHSRLLEVLDKEIGDDESAAAEAAALTRLEPRIREFLERGSETGTFVEEINDRTACQVLLDFWVSSLSQAGRPIPSVRLARFDSAKLPDLKDKPCPYVGLDPFRDRTYFFGREADIASLLIRLQSVPLVVVLGASGSGKSSLVLGGILPSFAQQASPPGLCVVPAFVPGNAVLEHLSHAVRNSRCKVGVGDDSDIAAFRQNSGHLGSMVGGPGAKPVVVTVDQFEEVFTLAEPADREALVANLAEFLKSDRVHRVILTVREEFRSRIVELQALSPYLDTAWYSMRPMGYAELRAAVEKPAALVNLQFQSGIIDDLVKKVLGQPAALPLLQFTLRMLWEKRDRNRITWEVYRKVGDPLKALAASADAFHDGLAHETQHEVKRIFLELVRVDELLEAYRQPVPKSRLLRAGRANTEDVLKLLDDNDYIRITSALSDTDAVVELKHESLVRNWPRLVSWIDEKRVRRRERLGLTQAAERWAKSGKPSEGLLTGWQLSAAENAAELLDLEKEYVQASFEAVDRVQREKEAALRREAERSKATANRFRTLSIATAVFAAIAIYAVYVAWGEIAKKIALELQAKARVLQAMRLQPLNYVDDQLDLALLLAIEANREEAQPELRRALLTALNTNLELKLLISGGHNDGVRAVAFSPDAQIVASGSYDSTIILWDAEQGKMLLPPLTGHTGVVYRIAFSPDGEMLASASEDHTVRLWNVKTGQAIATLNHDDVVYGVAIDKRGKMLASSDKTGSVQLWNLESRTVAKVLAHHNGRAATLDRAIYNVAFGPDGVLLASGGADGRIVFWDVEKGEQVGNPLLLNRPVFSMAWRHDGKVIASGNDEGRVDLWDVAARKPIDNQFPSHSSAVFGLAFSPDGRNLATVGKDRNVYILDTVDLNATPQRLNGYAGQFLSVDFASDGRVVTGTENATIAAWALNDYQRLGTKVAGPEGADFAQAAFAASANELVSFSGGQLLFWDLGTRGEQSRPIAVDARGIIRSIVLTRDRIWLVAIMSDNSVRLWDVSKRVLLKTLVGPGVDRIGAAAFSFDNTLLALAVADKIQLLNLPDGTPKATLVPARREQLGALAFSPDGATLASAQYWYGITLWSVATGQPGIEVPSIVDPRLNHPNIYSLVFSKDGKVLVSGGTDSVGFWSSSTGQPLGRPLGYHPGQVTSVAVSDDGNLLASSGGATVLLWDMPTRQPLSEPIRAHATGVVSVAFSTDGKWLVSASGGKDGSIMRWELDPDRWLSRACEVVGRNFTKDEWNQFFGTQDYRVSCPRVLAKEADTLALVGDRAGARKAFNDAVKAVVKTTDARASNSVCWFGSVDGFADVVLPACEKAVESAPDIARKRLYQESRGLARALTGNTDGAIEDLTAAHEYMRLYPEIFPADSERRKNWIAALKQGTMPFDEATLKSIRMN